jgi:hypothetical protein
MQVPLKYRDIVIHPRATDAPPGENLRTLPVIHISAEPMTFPLFFPLGDSGYHDRIPRHNKSKKTNNNVSIVEFYAYRIMFRSDAQGGQLFNPILRGGKLFQLYLVFAWTKAEEYRLIWIRCNQKSIKAEEYKVRGKFYGETLFVPTLQIWVASCASVVMRDAWCIA